MATSTETQDRLIYQPFSSIVNPGFWQKLTNIKLDKLKLSTEPLDIYGSYSCNLSENLPCLASFDHCSFNNDIKSGSKSTCSMTGQVVCMNMMQEFVDYDKKSFLNNQGARIWQSMFDGSALEDPEKHLSRFALLVYVDPKKYKYTYWFSFPAVNYPKNAHYKNSSRLPIADVFGEKALVQLQEDYTKEAPDRSFQRGYFIIQHRKAKSASENEEIRALPLIEYNSIRDDTDCDLYFAYSDPSGNQSFPGWPLRNYLALIASQFKLKSAKIIRIRGSPTTRPVLELNSSIIFEVNLELDENSNELNSSTTPACPIITGWEKNSSQQMAPHRVDLSKFLNPEKLAEDAVHINLRLMKWRQLPSLDLDKIAQTKCLLLGCGTLGCHVARGLLAWGVKNITLVDNSRVSYSNPVRQSLFTFQDCAKQISSFKSEAAAQSLKNILPSINVQAHVLSIPMPGHHVADNEMERTKKDVEFLERLIQDHDATFLLMDTRESRWLPTVIAKSQGKLVINAAIAFDSFLLQRYGIREYPDKSCLPQKGESSMDTGGESGSQSEPLKETGRESSSQSTRVKKLSSDKLGCYFCNDIVAPGDSTMDRTLDQQCTVSRPGVSMMVSAMAVELLASIVSSKQGSLTPAPFEIPNAHDFSEMGDEEFVSDLGIVPHSIRGDLASYHIYMPTSSHFNECSACSIAVVCAYREEGYDFLHKVFNDPNYLEEISGLKRIQEVGDDVWVLESDESVEG